MKSLSVITMSASDFETVSDIGLSPEYKTAVEAEIEEYLTELVTVYRSTDAKDPERKIIRQHIFELYDTIFEIRSRK